MAQQKSKQEKEGENLLIQLVKALFSKKITIRSGTVSDDLVRKGKRITFFVKGKEDK